MATDTFKKDPNAELDYAWNWSKWLLPISDTIASYTLFPDTGLTILDDDLQGNLVVAKIKGGKAGQTQKVVCRIVTVGGSMGPRTDERTLYLEILER